MPHQLHRIPVAGMDQYRQLLGDVDVDEELLVCAAGIEPATSCAQDTRATTALRTEVVGGVNSRAFIVARSIHEKFGSGFWIRTRDLQVMGLTRYYFSNPLQLVFVSPKCHVVLWASGSRRSHAAHYSQPIWAEPRKPVGWQSLFRGWEIFCRCRGASPSTAHAALSQKVFRNGTPTWQRTLSNLSVIDLRYFRKASA